ncbi:MAG: hypothetical protein ACYTBZ_26815, partial [Planctomycetota bacterium]
MANREDKMALVKRRLQSIGDANDIAGYDVTNIPLDPQAMEKTFRRDMVSQLPGRGPGVLERSPSPALRGLTAPDTLGGKIIEKAPQIAGGTIGGALGAVIPTIGEEGALAAGGTAFGNYVLAPLLAAGGGAGGRMMTLDPSDPQYQEKLFFAAIEEGAGDFGGRLLSAGLGRAFLRPARRAVEPGAEAADTVLRQSGRRKVPKGKIAQMRRGFSRVYRDVSEFMGGEPGAETRIAEEFGAHLLPGSATESVLDTIQGVAEGSFISGGKLRRFQGQSIPTALRRAGENLTELVRRSLINDVGEKRAKAILGSRISDLNAEAVEQLERGLYLAIDRLNPVGVDVTSLKSLAKSSMGRGLKPGARERMLRKAATKPDIQTFAELRDIRSDAWQEWQAFLRKGENKNARIAKQIATKADELMEGAAVAQGGVVERNFRIADTFHRGKLRTNWLEDTLKATSQADEAPGKNFVNRIKKMATGKAGKPSELSRMGFTDVEIEQIQGVANAAHFARKQAQGGGRMLIQLSQAG